MSQTRDGLLAGIRHFQAAVSDISDDGVDGGLSELDAITARTMFVELKAIVLRDLAAQIARYEGE